MENQSYKNELRKKHLAIRKTLSVDPEIVSKKLHNHLRNGFVASYSSYNHEVPTTHINQILAQEGRLVLPKVMNDQLLFFHVDDFSKLIHSKVGILEPNESLCKAADSIETLIIPGIAFDKQGYRLGYGKGHYDKFLAKTEAKKIGLVFEENILPEPLLRDSWDIPVDLLVRF